MLVRGRWSEGEGDPGNGAIAIRSNQHAIDVLATALPHPETA